MAINVPHWISPTSSSTIARRPRPSIRRIHTAIKVPFIDGPLTPSHTTTVRMQPHSPMHLNDSSTGGSGTLRSSKDMPIHRSILRDGVRDGQPRRLNGQPSSAALTSIPFTAPKTHSPPSWRRGDDDHRGPRGRERERERDGGNGNRDGGGGPPSHNGTNREGGSQLDSSAHKMLTEDELAVFRTQICRLFAERRRCDRGPDRCPDSHCLAWQVRMFVWMEITTHGTKWQ